MGNITTIHMDLLSFVKETIETVSWRTKVGHIHIFVKDISETICFVVAQMWPRCGSDAAHILKYRDAFIAE